MFTPCERAGVPGTQPAGERHSEDRASEQTLQKSGDSTEAIVALESFTVPEALPYLNNLLFDPIYYTRMSAILSIDRLADRSSVPFLILALRDPDPQQLIEPSAWVCSTRSSRH